MVASKANEEFEEYKAALGRLSEKYGHFTLEVDFVKLSALVGTLQLAMRHRPFQGSKTYRVVRRMVDEIIAQLAKDEAKLAAIMRTGNDPRRDGGW